MKILCICLSATIQRTLTFEEFTSGQVNRTSTFVEHASGKALNTARVINQLKDEYGSELWKTQTAVLCPAGKENKKRFLQLAKKDNIKVFPVYTDGTTRQCWTLLDSKNHTTTELIADETNSAPQTEKSFAKAERKLLSKLEKLLKKYNAVIFAGSCPSYFSKDLPLKICSLIKQSGSTLLVDFCGEHLTKVLKTCTPDIIKINQEEFEKTFNLEATPQTVAELSEKLSNVIVVTRGAEETWCGALGTSITYPVEKITPVNTTACGDSFNAGFMIEYLKSGNLEDALKLGTDCAKRNALNTAPGWIEN